MPLRPIDAIFVNPERRRYVVYFRGELWQLPRMKIDYAAWQRRQPYDGDINTLYLSSNQAIADPILAQKLRTLNLPAAVHGSTLPRFESWWAFHGFEWLKDKLTTGESPLAAHQALQAVSTNMAATQATDKQNAPVSSFQVVSNDASSNNENNPTQQKTNEPSTAAPVAKDADIFAHMLADLVDEVLNHQE